MNIGGIIFMTFSWGIILWLLIFSFWRIFKKKS
jgi:hypothetical protein